MSAPYLVLLWRYIEQTCEAIEFWLSFLRLGDLQVGNFTFGGKDNNALYIMADTVIGAAEIKATGGTRPQPN